MAARREQQQREMAAMLDQLKLPDDWKLLPVDPNYRNQLQRHHCFRGTVFTNFHQAWGLLEIWKRFQARPKDVIVASFPKSGTTWLQELVWRMGNPRLIKTHLPYDLLPPSVHTSDAKVLYVTRDPRDVCVSYHHYCRMVNSMEYRGTFQEFRDSFARGEVMYAPYREHVQGYLRHADTVLCVTYEQLHADRAAVVRRVAAFLERSVTDAEAESIARHTSFETMKENPGTNYRHWEKTGMVNVGSEVTFMRKGQVGDWKNYFTEEEGAAFLKWAKQPV
ncbi:sulfotransferase family cytosolic 1B member 1-like [Pollicipes pollicipes]|uniref:sulfotransferase family cytosolic 1B member 1-like n=1 Tax=Pollicipes pollicipes TaxID=41117 RepID=UPI0018849AF8|nr:sulfotransferase family cytosolic 1B member 1-like [Pollicipes pollicipes]